MFSSSQNVPMTSDNGGLPPSSPLSLIDYNIYDLLLLDFNSSYQNLISKEIDQTISSISDSQPKEKFSGLVYTL